MSVERFESCANCAHYDACNNIMKRYTDYGELNKDAPACGYYAVRLEDILGDTYDLDRLRELVEADKDGRCVVLPCKPSDTTVYQILGKKHARGPAVKMRHVYCATVWSGGRYQLEHQGMTPCRGNELGKTWFLNEEAAEAALAKEASHE